jgi:signal transduction histidine kinase
MGSQCPSKVPQLTHSNLKRDVFVVRDSGIGVPQCDIARLFESFHRGTNVGNIAGTGLGLAIVKRAVELHSGTIAVHSVQGDGTEFSVRVPRRQPAA